MRYTKYCTIKSIGDVLCGAQRAQRGFDITARVHSSGYINGLVVGVEQDSVFQQIYLCELQHPMSPVKLCNVPL